MKRSLLLIVSLFFFVISASAEAVMQQVTSVVSFRFPSAPHISGKADQTGYIYQTDSCSYQVQTKVYNDEGKVHDSITLAAFYDGTSKGMLKAAKGTLLTKTYINVDKLKGMEVEFVRNAPNSLPTTVCSRVLLLNGQVLIYSFTSPSERYTALKKLREQFLSSISFNKDSSLLQYRYALTAVQHEPPPTVAAKSDTVVKALPQPVSFINSHAGAVIKMFGLLILFSAIIYFFATLSRRKG